MYYSELNITRSARDFLYKVYGWMAGALAITAGTAYYIYQTPTIFYTLYKNPAIIWGLFIGQIVLAIMLSAMITRLSFAVTVGMYCLYAVLMGITISSIFFVYDIYSIYLVFGVTAAMFGAMALYGYLTKSDLSAIGSMATMALFGIIIGFLINLFLRSESFNYVLTVVGVIVFTLLTAYDVQKIKQLGVMLQNQGETASKASILGALTLYLDFINLFLMLLQLMGKRKEN